eukprot:gene13224-13355_t
MSQRNAVNSLPPINTNDLAFEPGPLSAVLAALCATPSGFLTTPKLPGNVSMAEDNHGAAAAPERATISNVQQEEVQDKDMLCAQLQQKQTHPMQLSRKPVLAEHEAGNAVPDVSHPSDSNKRQRLDPMAEVDVLRQQNQALLQRLTSAMGTGVLVHEENATLRR